MRVTILHNTTTDSLGRHIRMMDGYQPGDSMRDVFAYTSQLDDPVAVAEEAYRLFNVGDDPDFGTPSRDAIEYRKCGLRSLSVGDVVRVGDTVNLACASCGWKELASMPPTEGELAAARRAELRNRFHMAQAREAITLGLLLPV